MRILFTTNVWELRDIMINAGTNDGSLICTVLCRFHGVKTSALFTTKGTKYYHHFNISICQNDPNARASCYSNVSFSKSEVS